MLSKLLKDPLTHFLLAGAIIFGVSTWLNPPEPGTAGRIVISAADVARMRKTIELVQGRPATSSEVEALIEVNVREEVLYREALAAGLDRDDTLVRTRLIEKMRFLTENVAEPAPPTAAELEAFFAAQAARFHVPAQVTFEQVFFDPQRRGVRAEAEARAALPGLRGRRESLTPDALARLGDPLPLWNRYDTMALRDIALAFGDEFATRLEPLAPGSWQGPVKSRFGWHLVRVVNRAAARQPELVEVRDAVTEAWLNERRQAGNEARYRALRERYDVVVEPVADSEPPAAEPAAVTAPQS